MRMGRCLVNFPLISRASRLAAPLLLCIQSCTSAPASKPAQPVVVSTSPAPESTPTVAYPPTRRVDARDIFHGVVVPDPYRWLEDGRDPEVIAWSKAQDEFARAKLQLLPARVELTARVKELMYAGEEGIPRRFGDMLFYSRRDKGKEKQTVYVRPVRGGPERALLDPNQWPEDQLLTLEDDWPSFDGKKILYRVSKNRSDRATLHVMDVATGVESISDSIQAAPPEAPAWSADGSGFYYRIIPPGAPSDEQYARAPVRYHRLGTDPKSDPTVREATGDPQIFEYVSASRDGRWLFLKEEHGYTRVDWYVRDSSARGTSWTPLAAGREAKNDVIDYRGAFYLRTTDGAPRGRLVRVLPRHPEREQWKEIVPERADASLDGFLIAGGKLLLRWSKDAAAELEIRDLDGAESRRLELPAIGAVSAMSGRPEDDEAYIQFESYMIPPAIYSLSTSARAGRLRVFSKLDLPGVDPSRYAIERIFSTSKDGTRVPMFVVRRRDLALDGQAPVYMSGYGGFAWAPGPTFAARLLAWVERGGVFVGVAARGGPEYGEEWHRAAMRTKKQNTFDDIIGAAEDLIRRGWARPEHMAFRGASNGGLTTAAVITQRPDLFRVAVCGVPVIDVIRSPLFGNGKDWAAEYGSPENPEEFKAMFAYSPYHHIERGTRYPSLLVLSADSDDRVDPLHARKFVAAMQAASERPVLLEVRKNAGHFGTDFVGASAEYDGEMAAFMLSEMGIR